MNEGYADVAYEETPELIEAQKRAAINQRPVSYTHLDVYKRQLLG